MPAIANTKSIMETWVLAFTFVANQPNSTPSYGSVQRYAGGVTITTSSTPFYLPSGQSARIVDLYIISAATQDCLVDFQINEINQRLNLDLAARLATNAGRKGLPRPVDIPSGASFRPLAYPVGTAIAATQLAYLDAFVG